MNKGLKRNGVKVSVEKWESIYKKPVLVLGFDGENTVYKVASFNNDEAAMDFIEAMGKFFAGLVKEAE